MNLAAKLAIESNQRNISFFEKLYYLQRKQFLNKNSHENTGIEQKIIDTETNEDADATKHFVNSEKDSENIEILKKIPISRFKHLEKRIFQFVEENFPDLATKFKPEFEKFLGNDQTSWFFSGIQALKQQLLQNPLDSETNSELSFENFLNQTKDFMKSTNQEMFLKRKQILKPFGLILFEKVLGFSRDDFETEEDFENSILFPEKQKESKDLELHDAEPNENLEKISKFVQFWRAHFLETMKPGFLNPFWDVSRDIRK